jgi:hypothetical protein
LWEQEVFVPKNQAISVDKFSHGPLDDGPQAMTASKAWIDKR